MFHNIPHELRVLKQWVVWRFEHTKNQAKLTKVPYNPRTGRHASSTDAVTWSDFEVCVAAVEANVGWHGIGYVLSPNDPYCFIDLDPVKDEHGNVIDRPDIYARQHEIFRVLNSYSELSPSRAGLHIITKANVPSGRKRDFVEIYSSGRFMTMTGDVYLSAPIEDRQQAVMNIWQSLVSPDIDFSGRGDGPQLVADETIFAQAQGAQNGAKFNDLWNGDWQKYYTSQSEADFALIDILGFYTYNREQIERMFKLSALGQRDKANRKDYVSKMILAAEDRRPPTVTLEATQQIRAEIAALIDAPPDSDSEIAQPEKVETIPPPEEWIYPPGLLGRMADFIYEASPRPVRQIALVAAVAMLAGIVGRSWNVSGTGLNLYLMLVAPTGTGKEAISSGMDKLFNAVTQQFQSASDFIGPGDFASAQALIKSLAVKPSCVVVSGEFGLRLQQMASKHASTNDIGIKRMLLDLYNKSGRGQSIKPLVYSDKDKDTKVIRSPALTLIGETTPTTLYQSLDENLISDGLLPRFITTEYTGQRPPLNEQHGYAYPDLQLVADLQMLCHFAHSYAQKEHVVDVQFSEGGKDLSKKFDRYADSQINSTQNDVNRQLWNRAHIKALKLAAIVAVGINPWEPVIDEHCMNWACTIVSREITTLLQRFERGEVGRLSENELAQVDYIRDKIKEYLTTEYDKLQTYKVDPALHADGLIEWSYLHRRCANISTFKHDKAGATNAIKRAIQMLTDSGVIAEVGRPVMTQKYGKWSRSFIVLDSRTL